MSKTLCSWSHNRNRLHDYSKLSVFFSFKALHEMAAFNLLQLHWGDVRLQFIYLFEDLNPPHQSPPRKPIRLLMSRLELAKTET